MNETNRTAIVLFAALWIVLMAVVIFIAWSDSQLAVDRLDDFVQYLNDHQDNAAKLILTLGALVLIVLSLLVIIVEFAPEEQAKEIRVEQAGATTIVPSEPLRLRLEEALTTLAHVSAAKARVFSQDKGVGMKLDLTLTPDSNVAVVTQEASRVVVETLQADLGLPVAAPPSVRVTFGPAKEPAVASSVTQPPQAEQAPGAPPSPPPPSDADVRDQPQQPSPGERTEEPSAQEEKREAASPEDMWPSEPPSEPETQAEDETQPPF